MVAVGTAAYDSFGSCTSACQNSSIRRFRLLYICRLPISSFFLRKKENIRHQRIQQLVSHPRIMCTPCDTNSCLSKREIGFQGVPCQPSWGSYLRATSSSTSSNTPSNHSQITPNYVVKLSLIVSLN
jgi:hypothetical protein